MKYIIDSSAWIEYLEGSKSGEIVNKILDEDNEIFIIPLIISEVISKTKRKKQNYELAYETLIENAKINEISPKIAKEAGLLHAQMKDKISSISLADTMIITAAKALSAKIITCDEHFKGLKEIILI